MMARRLPGILPPLTFDEALEVTAGAFGCRVAPARAKDFWWIVRFGRPHHTISDVALIGGWRAGASPAR